MTADEVMVLVSGGRRVPRPLTGLPVLGELPADLPDLRRLIVIGTHADLGAVLTRLLRTDRLDVEVALVRRPWSARRARTAGARRIPLIRDETGTVLTRSALWLPPDDAAGTLTGEAVVDDTTLFDGEVASVRIEPTVAMPGLRASVANGRLRPRRWVTGRAAQLGTTGAIVVRDGRPSTRPVRRSTFYRHTRGWLAVR